MKVVLVLALAILGVLGNGQQQLPSARTLLPTNDDIHVPAQMRTITDLLGGTWFISWIDMNGHVIGNGEKVWKIAPGGGAFIEENVAIVRAELASAGVTYELIVVSDGSADETAERAVAAGHSNVRVIRDAAGHPRYVVAVHQS